MPQQEKHFDIAKAIDQHLNSDVTLTSEYKYQPWYAIFLSSMALLASKEEVLYAHVNYGQPITEVRIVVFTTNLVFIADIDPNLDGVPVVVAVPRSFLIGITFSASERIDARDGRSFEWPGTLALILTYRELQRPIEIVASGVNQHSLSEPPPIVSLLEALSEDLTASR